MTYQTVDPQRCCPKCGGLATLEHIHHFGWAEFRLPVEYPGGLIRRTCERCAHTWWETPLDHVPVPDDEVRRHMKELADRSRSSFSAPFFAEQPKPSLWHRIRG